MNKILIIVCLLIGLITQSFGMSKNKIPSKIKEYVSFNYQNVKYLKYERYKIGHYERYKLGDGEYFYDVSFKYNGLKTILTFQNETLIKIQQETVINKLPVNVENKLTSYKVEHIVQIIEVNNNNAIFYDIRYSKGKYLYDATFCEDGSLESLHRENERANKTVGRLIIITIVILLCI